MQYVKATHMTATLSKCYEEKGRHEIIAGGKNVNLPSKDHTLVLKMEERPEEAPDRNGSERT